MKLPRRAHQAESKCLGLAPQGALVAGAAHVGISAARAVIWSPMFDHGVEDPGQLVGGSRGCRFRAEFGSQAAEPVAELALGAVRHSRNHWM